MPAGADGVPVGVPERVRVPLGVPLGVSESLPVGDGVGVSEPVGVPLGVGGADGVPLAVAPAESVLVGVPVPDSERGPPDGVADGASGPPKMAKERTSCAPAVDPHPPPGDAGAVVANPICVSAVVARITPMTPPSRSRIRGDRGTGRGAAAGASEADGGRVGGARRGGAAALAALPPARGAGTRVVSTERSTPSSSSSLISEKRCI
jgi:hypothetical protein